MRFKLALDKAYIVLYYGETTLDKAYIVLYYGEITLDKTYYNML